MLFDDLEPMEAGASSIEYDDDTVISDDDRQRICCRDTCIEHGTGTVGCPVPMTWGQLRDEEPDDCLVPNDRYTDDGEVIVDQSARDVDFDEVAPVPDDATCPYCGGDAEAVDPVAHRLSAIGYTHDDVEMECADCESTWPLGIPIGEFEGEEAEDLFCSSCEKRFMRVHRVVPRWRSEDKVMLHLKCPNCYYFDKQQRVAGDGGKVLVGYPDITGSVANAAEPEGY